MFDYNHRYFKIHTYNGHDLLSTNSVKIYTAYKSERFKIYNPPDGSGRSSCRGSRERADTNSLQVKVKF
jgi:hypothetical protein